MKKTKFGVALLIGAALFMESCTNPTSSSSSESAELVPVEVVKVSGGTVVGKENTNNDKGVFVEGRTVVIKDFYMAKYETTQEEYKSVMQGQKVIVDGTEYTLDAEPSDCYAGNIDYQVNFGTVQGKRPVENVTWYDAVYYCNVRSEKEGFTKAYDITVKRIKSKHIISATVKLVEGANGYRLPTECEWEYAARGGDPTAQAWDYTFSGANAADETKWEFSGNEGLDSVGWYCYNNDTGSTGEEEVSYIAAGCGTHQVGQKAPNALGLYDMSGNVCEWCYDLYSANISESMPETGATYGYDCVWRGGSWGNYGIIASVCFRFNCSPSDRSDNLGFRVVRSAVK